MKSFLRVATLILVAAGGVYGYEFVTGEPLSGPRGNDVARTDDPASAIVQRAQQAAATRTPVSKSGPHRIRTDRTVDTETARPARPAHLERMIEARGGSDFPILLPPAMTKDAVSAERHDVRLKLLDDGYSAVLTVADMDIVIYGTRTVYRRQAAVDQELKEVDQELRSIRADMQQSDPATARQTGGQTDDQGQTSRRLPPHDPKTGAPLPRVRKPYIQRFEEAGEGRGGSISIGRFGVDYHIEFYCHPVPNEETAPNCIDEAGARAFVTEMEGEA